MSEHKSATELLHAVLAVVPDGEKVAELFAEEGALELPYLHSFGMETRYEGHEAIAAFYVGLTNLYPDFGFKPEDTTVLIETPEKVAAEYVAHSTSAGTGRRVHLLFPAVLIAEQGKIKLLREAVNVLASAQAIFPGGAKDLPDPEAEIHSYKPE